jgi:hypothetical protein
VAEAAEGRATPAQTCGRRTHERSLCTVSGPFPV